MAEFDPNALSDDDLEKAFDTMKKGDEFVPPATEGEPTPPVEPEPEPEAEPTPEPEAPAEEEAPSETPAEDPEAERLRLISEEMEARAKHWESVAGKHAGELGYIKQQLKAIQAAQAQSQQGEEYVEPQETPRPAPEPQRRDGLAEWAVQQAFQQAVTGFEHSHPDVADIGDKMVDYLSATGYDMKTALAMGDPIEAQQEIARALNEAYWHTKAEVNAARRAELTAKREAVQTQAATNKMKASVSATGSSPPPKPKAKTVDEMTDDELAAEMVKAQGGRW